VNAQEKFKETSFKCEFMVEYFFLSQPLSELETIVSFRIEQSKQLPEILSLHSNELAGIL
jgi:hypothetical protein